MGIFNTPGALLAGLKPAAFRGLTFHMPDTSVEVGRRIVATYFPGVDGRSVEDLGRDDGSVRVAGLIIGDDYIQSALSLQAALQARGPGTLLHPWLGEMTVVVPEGAASIRFNVAELRCVRFEVTFKLVPAGDLGVIAATLSALLGSVSSLVSAAQGLCTAVMGAATMGVAVWSAATSLVTSVGALASSAVSSSLAHAVVGDAVALNVAYLDTAAAGGGGAEDAAVIAAALTALVVPVAEAALGAAPSAIGAGGSASVSVPVLTARTGASLLLAIAGEIRASDAVGVPAAAARLAAGAAVLAYAVEVAADITYESRQDAAAWRDLLVVEIDATETAAIALADDAPAPVATLLGALGELRAALARDLNEVMGRLPSVRLVTPADTVSAWLLAQHFAGDNPSLVGAMFTDIVTRNRLRHPGAVPPEPVEVLA
ncbi:DNA circularization N-terminal domain-containing protein [Azorhizobium doebereinerae]|uniref:DNA circularization N-terminal domain-containing protein n=1 Tax=Azorhizobium doebereinerae TaxID=281091 RepID=UPI000416F478|nr:DNA circularization N-terminal domain-containing protein [Azorhizobium doebereinerae]